MSQFQIQQNKDLTNEHTFGVPWKGSFFVAIKDEKQIMEVIEQRATKDVLVLGGGSNILPTKKFKGIVMQNKIKGKEVTGEGKTFFDIRVGAGENWHAFVLYAIRKDMFGLENLSLIPGTVGGALVQNIGAYDVEISQYVQFVEALDLKTGEKRVFKKNEMDLSYRHSIFKHSGKYIVTHVTLRLSKKFRPVLTYKPLQKLQEKKDLNAKEVSREVMKVRMSKLPDWNIIGTAGSFFANPRVSQSVVKKLQKNYPDMPVFYNYGSKKATIPGGWLMEHASLSLKDRKEFLYHKHSLIVVNNEKGENPSQGKGKRIRNFIEKAIKTVENDFGITLKPEVKIF